MGRKRIDGDQGNATPPEDEEETNPVVETPSAHPAPEASTPSDSLVGDRSPLGGRPGVRIMFNACERDEHGTIKRPGERIVSEEEALQLVKLGVATLL